MTYQNCLPDVFPWRVPVGEPDANTLIRILLRNDKRSRPDPMPNGSSFAWTADNYGNLWLSQVSYERIVRFAYGDAKLSRLIGLALSTARE